MSVFGVGYSDLSKSYECGKVAASTAMAQAGLSKGEADCCMVFCTSRHDPKLFTDGLKSVIGESRFIGGYTNGASTNDASGYDGFQGIVGVFQSATVSIDLFLEEGIAFNEEKVGQNLARQILSSDLPEDVQMLIFFDAVNRQKGYFQMNYGTPFVKGMDKVLPSWPKVAGARFLGDMSFKPTYQWFENRLVQNSATAMIFKGDITMDVEIMHGCTPASAYHTITKTDGATILEINDIPALVFMEQLFGAELAQDFEQLKFFVTVGKNLGDKWGGFDAHNYVNRMCVGIDKKRGGLRMAEIDIVPGSEIQFMRRGYNMDYVEQQTSDIISRIIKQNRKPIFALYLNCAGRAATYSENTEEDTAYISKAIDGRFPMLGIYEAGELAMVENNLEILDWTGVFCLFSEPITS